MVLSFILIQNRQGKTRLAKWYAPYTDEEKVKLKGEVCSSCPPSVAMEDPSNPPTSMSNNGLYYSRFIVSLRLATRSTSQTSSSSDPRLRPPRPPLSSGRTFLARRSYIEDMRVCSSASVSMQMTMSWPTWRLYISLSKC